MELRYCEDCGDILQPRTDGDAAAADGFGCARCDGIGNAELISNDARTDAKPVATLLDPDSTTTLSSESAATHDPMELSDGTSGDEGLGNAHQDGANVTEPTDVVRREVTGPQGDRAAEADPKFTMRDDTIEKPGAAATMQAVSHLDVPLFEDVGEGEPVGSLLPASRAQKIVFRCPHCRSALSIRPVQSTSRLLCPACDHSVYVTISGRTFDKPPSDVTSLETPAESGAALTEGGAGARRERTDDVVSTKRMMAAALKTFNPLEDTPLAPGTDKDGTAVSTDSELDQGPPGSGDAGLAGPRKPAADEGGNRKRPVESAKTGARSPDNTALEDAATAEEGTPAGTRRRAAGTPTASRGLHRGGKGGHARAATRESLTRKAEKSLKRLARTRSGVRTAPIGVAALVTTALACLPIAVLSGLPFLEDADTALAAPADDPSPPPRSPTIRRRPAAATREDGSRPSTLREQVGESVRKGVRSIRGSIESLSQ